MTRFSQYTLLLAATIALCPFASHAAQAPLHSPWDAQPIALTHAAYTCPDPPPFSKSIDADSYYSDAHHSIVDPKALEAERNATEAPTHLGEWATQAADAYRTHGSSAAAACVYALLDAAARAHAWAGSMPTPQGSYEQKWLLASVSVAYLKVRLSGAGSPDQEKEIRRWLDTVATSAIDYVERKESNPESDAWNNHRYWAGLAVCAAGIATGDRSDYEWGIASYKAGVDRIQPDGALPREMARAGRALHYHIYALAPLVMIAELAEANGLDLYSYKNGAIHRLVRVCISGLEDPGIFGKATGVLQEDADVTSGAYIGWAVPYVKRFPDAQLSAWIAHAHETSFWQWGGLPPGAGS
ncbi:MAG TPA: alginate lyase family protein [Terracidiphilus sp.]|jgi:poly(beta-D-mannuronate) lyase